MSKVSGAQIIAVVGWLSVIAAPWYIMIAGRSASPAMWWVMAVSAVVGTMAGFHHEADTARQRKAADAVTEELKRAALSRMAGGRGLGA